MFLFRSFQRKQPNNDKQPDKNHRVVDMSEPQSFTPSLGSHTHEPVISVQETQEEGFSCVDIRPLTYAEVATMAGPEGTSASEKKIYMPSDIDDQHLSAGGGDVVDEYYSNSEEPAPQQLLRRHSTGPTSEFEYGEVAVDVLSRNSDWGKVRHTKWARKMNQKHTNKQKNKRVVEADLYY